MKELTTDTAGACCTACGAADGCMGWNWCSSGAGCDGGLPWGACHLKTWVTDGGLAEAWGCSGEGQGWRSGFMSSVQAWKATPPACQGGGAAAAGQVSGVDGVTGATRANWQGAVLLLDTDGQKMGEGGNHGSPYVRSVSACAAACARFRNREGVAPNAFTYCDAPGGCGSGCQQFRYRAFPSDGSARPEVFFGPFGKGCDSTNPDAYAHQLCSCKTVQDLGAPPSNSEPGWVSGPVAVA